MSHGKQYNFCFYFYHGFRPLTDWQQGGVGGNVADWLRGKKHGESERAEMALQDAAMLSVGQKHRFCVFLWQPEN